MKIAARRLLIEEGLTVSLLLLLAGAGCSNPFASTCKSGVCLAGAADRAGVRWEVLSVSQNVPSQGAGAGAAAPSTPPILALRANSIRQSLALGLGHTCALAQAGARAGQVVCWGDNRAGQVGNGASDAGPILLPAKVAGLPDPQDDFPLQIAAGDSHSCALTASGNVYCWGSNAHGQLGVDPGTLKQSGSAVLAAGGAARSGIVFSQLAAGGDQTCALSTRSTAYCWGSNASGQLGNGTTADSFVPSPVLVDGKAIPFGHLTTSANHTCAAEGPEGDLSWGSVYCWGEGTSGQLANTTAATPLAGLAKKIYPTPVLGLHNAGSRSGLVGLQLIERVASGANHSCGMTFYGNYYCWGDNSEDQLGIVTAIGQGNAMLDYSNYFGGPYASTAFGDPPGGAGEVTFLGGPVPYTSGSVSYGSPQIASGSNHVCVLPTDSGCRTHDGFSACCWGSNRAGQLGPNFAGGVSPSWVGVAPGSPGAVFNELAAGGDHTCGVSSDGEIYCWGDNTWGQLGSGQGPSTPVPQAVPGGPFFVDVKSALPPPPAPAGRKPLVDCRINPQAGGAPNQGNLSSYLFYAGDIFTRPTRLTEVAFELWSDSTTLANAFALTVYSYSAADRSYRRLGQTTSANIFPFLGSGGVATARFVFGGAGLFVPVPDGQGPLPVVMQLTQLSGITLNFGANLISNAETVECPISAAEAAASIPLQIYTE